jgi:hypothetical protein
MLATRLKFHVIHEVLQADPIKDTVGIYEEHEKVVMPCQIFGIDLVNQLEGVLLTTSLPAMFET